MKKWWIGSLTMILMLLAFPLVAVTEELKCPEHPDATLTLTNIKKEDRHHVYWTCNQGQHEVLGYRHHSSDL